MKKAILTLLGIATAVIATAQRIPIDTVNWDINANAYVIERYRGKEAIYLQGGSITWKDTEFLNGTIEYDIYLREVRGFPGVYFRAQDDGDAEQFYLRPHQSGNPDATQAVPTTKNITPWQLYHGDRYSFTYDFKKDDWTHVKILVKGAQAQVFLDWSETPHLSWNTFHEVRAGMVVLTGGNATGLHLADIKISTETPTLTDFQPVARKPEEGIVSSWSVSDKFSEELLAEGADLEATLQERSWVGRIEAEEGTAANFSRIHDRFDGSQANTALAKLVISSSEEQMKLFEFGYSDRVIVLLNGTPIYRGTNRFRSRDYRYLGTIGLFDTVYLPLKEGDNELILAVSEDFGGWLVTGRFIEPEGIKIR